MERRLPIYFLLDTSESMIGEPLAVMQGALHDILAELRRDPQIIDMAHVCFIPFNSYAKPTGPLTNIVDVETPKLKVRPGTALGEAFLVLKQCIDKEVVKTTSEEGLGDYRPLVFLITDGCPTDTAEIRRESLMKMTSPKIANIYSIACGEDCDLKFLQSISDKTFRTRDMTPELIRNLFIWLSASIQTSVMSLTTAAREFGLDMLSKPDGVELVERGINDKEYTGPTPTIFFKVYCSKTNMPYLIRYRYDISEGGYVPVKTHKLETGGEDDFIMDAPTIRNSQLRGLLSCPYCGNGSFLNCGCGAKVCLPIPFGKQWHCIRCNQSGTFTEGSGGDFEITQSLG